jgi:hypothetical protein
MAEYRREYKKIMKEVDQLMQNDDSCETFQNENTDYKRLPVYDDALSVSNTDTSQPVNDAEFYSSSGDDQLFHIFDSNPVISSSDEEQQELNNADNNTLQSQLAQWMI